MNDTERLDFLQDILFGKVICRDSTKGRGFRLHQTRSEKHASFESVRDAIDAYHDKLKNNKPDPHRCHCGQPNIVEGFYDFCNNPNCGKLL